MALQESGQMYLETILILTQKSNSVRAIDVGEYMGYSKPSVILLFPSSEPHLRHRRGKDLRA